MPRPTACQIGSGPAPQAQAQPDPDVEHDGLLNLTVVGAIQLRERLDLVRSLAAVQPGLRHSFRESRTTSLVSAPPVSFMYSRSTSLSVTCSFLFCSMSSN